MKIALIGASGFIGSKLLKEALSRGHDVTALVSNPEKIAGQPHLAVAKVDVLDTTALASLLSGHEAVITAFSGHARADTFDYYLKGFRSIVAATKQSNVPRLLAVGGAGSLETPTRVQLVDTPDFPEQWKQSALGAREALNLLRHEHSLNWTMLSPSAVIAPGKRTGRFRLGDDGLLVDAQGQSTISLEDYAVAMVDELEQPAHSRRRFTVGY